MNLGSLFTEKQSGRRHVQVGAVSSINTLLYKETLLFVLFFAVDLIRQMGQSILSAKGLVM